MTQRIFLYKNFGFYMSRKPLLDREIIDSILSLENLTYSKIFEKLEDYNQKELFLEAIYISSPSLYYSILNYDKKSQKKQKDIIKSLYHYLKRIAYRSTPFGIYASVGMGEFSDTTIENKENCKYKKNLLISDEWKINFIKKKIKNNEYFRRFKVFINPTVIKKDRLFHWSSISFVNSDIVKEFKIDNNIIINSILEKTEEPILIEKLEQLILNIENININANEVLQVLYELVEKEFLILSIEKYREDPLELMNQKEWNLYKHIQKLIEKYGLEKMNSGLPLLQEITKNLNLISKCSAPLKVDLYNTTSSQQLPTKVGDEINELTSVLYKLSSADKSLSGLENFTKKFLEKYGSDKIVPLLKVIDSDKGIGNPYELPYFDNNSISKSQTYLMNLLFTKQRNSQEILLDDYDIDMMQEDKIYFNQPNSLELYLEVSMNEKNDYLLTLAPNKGSKAAGNSFGRFTELRKNDLLNDIQCKIEKRTDKQIIYADIGYLPSNLKNLEVSNNKYTSKYLIPINYQNNNQIQIPLSDIWIGINKQRLFLKSKRLNKQIIPNKMDMVNYTSFPPIVRLLCDMQFSAQNTWMPFQLGLLNNLDFIPRIKYKNTVIIKARWLLNLKMLEIETMGIGINFNEFIIKFNDWCSKNNIPKLVHLESASKRLIYNLTNLNDMKEIHKVFCDLNDINKKIMLEEATENYDLQKKEEIVVPVYSPARYNSNLDQNISEYIDDFNYLPGSKWLSLKIYFSKSSQDFFLNEFVLKYTSFLQSKKYINEWFYIRYTDPEDHIRLRLKTLNKFNINFFLEDIKSSMNKMNININDLVIDTYKPEYIRYGNENLMPSVEHFFKIDSQLSLYIMNEVNSYNSKFDLIVLSVISLIYSFNISIDVFIKWIDNLLNYKVFLDIYRNKKVFFNSHIELDKKNIIGLKPETLLKLEERKEYCEILSKKIKEQQQDHYKILTDFIHLHVNRVIGNDKNVEKMVLGVVRHTLANIENRQKYYENK
ncbi:lantibiotic dehydratase [Viridibacillus arvi]|uniref:lantibiotic dehydratase n=1 Tax=Viridibacillus arvi TaxID=263475 RepID=UPI003D2E093E